MNESVVHKREPDDRIIALIGNPNVGKSTLFNGLTGLNQHTGNWPGKTVSVAQGRYTYKGKGYILVDLPGTYSLFSQSEEERIAVEYLRSGQADCTLVLADATCLERNLNLILQVLEVTDHIILCVNLLDEAARRKIELDLTMLEHLLGIPVVGMSAGRGQGIEELKEKLRNMSDGFLYSEPKRCNSSDTSVLERRAAEIADKVVKCENKTHSSGIDRFALGKWSGRLLLLLLLFVIFWLTIQGANYPSMLLQSGFDYLELHLRKWLDILPDWPKSLIIDGIYMTVTRVIAVMLPPMAIFFPLFTVLEDLGYLPRAAFLMDRSFQRCGGCGKQVLTMSMGFGCNAVGVIGCRIISSPKERLIAILTNALVPCNGRFPAVLTLISIFFTENSILGALVLTGFILLSVGMTFLASKLLHNFILKGGEGGFILELPPYRKPQIGKIIVRSLLDRTVFVLGRAVAVAAPAGAVIWLLQRLTVDGNALLTTIATWLEPIGCYLGMSGVILLAFFLSFPANELLLPLIVMILQGGVIGEVSVSAMGRILTGNGWTAETAICTILFLLFHWPCGTTCLTIHKETNSWAWTVLAIILPTLIGILLCRLAACVI